MDIALIGPSGSGKGTHIDRLKEEFGFRHLCPGNLFRENIRRQTNLGLVAQRYIDHGELVPDSLVEAMIETEIRKVPAGQPILFDGFPATLDQAHFLTKILADVGRDLGMVAYLDVLDETLEKQISGRLICPRCQSPYNEKLHNFKVCPNGSCQGATLYRREDDMPETARVRLDAYYGTVSAVLDYYERQRKLCIIDGNGLIEWVSDDIIALVKAAREQTKREASRDATEKLQTLKPTVKIPAEEFIRPSLDIVLFGPPGSGKGTQAVKISKRFDIPHINTGEIFRENLDQHSALGQIAKAYMERGELVPDDITEGMIRQRLTDADSEKGFVLDGFPRTLHQAESLMTMSNALHRRLTGVIHIRVPDRVTVTRLSGRLTCRSCTAVYHRVFRPPEKANTCDECGGELYQRFDDDPDVIRMRLQTFHRRTDPVLDFYRQKGVLAEVDGEGPVSSVTEHLIATVERLQASIITST